MVKQLKRLIGHRKFLGLLDRAIYSTSALIVVLLFSKILSKEQFGLWGIVMSLFMMFCILESFFQTATVKFCATHQKQKFDDVISSLIYLKTFSVIIFVALVWLFRPLILHVYKGEGLNEILMLFPFAFLSFTLRSHFVSIIRAKRDMRGLLWQDVVLAGAYIGLGLLFMRSITTAKDVFVIYLVSHLISVVYLWGRYPEYFKFRLRIDKDLTKEIFNFGKYSALVGIGGVLYQNVDILMIGWLNSIGDVGVYKIGRISATFVLIVSQGLLLTMLPEISHLNEKNKVAEIKRVYSRNVKLMLQIFIPFFILSLLFAHSAYSFFFQDKYAGASAVFVIFSASGIIRAFGNPQGALLAGVGLVRLDSIQMLGTVVVDLILNILMIPPLKSIGAALSTVIALSVGTVMKKYFLQKYYFVKKAYALSKT